MDVQKTLLARLLLPLGSALVGLIVIDYVLEWKRARSRLPFPPGPKPKPIIGNMLDFPRRDIAMQYHKWGKEYNSDIIHTSALGTHVIALNSLEDAEELLERRASIYSDRIYMPMVDLMGSYTNMAAMPHGPLWRHHRRIAQQNFRLDAMSAQEPIQLRRVHLMLRSLLENPDSIFMQTKVLSLSIPLEFMYGYDVKSLEDPYIVKAQKLLDLSLEYFDPSSTLINFFPILGRIPAWFPGATAQRAAAKIRTIQKELETEPMEMVTKAVDEGVAVPSVLSEFIETARGTSTYEEESQIMSQLALTIYSGASDTIICALDAFIYVLATRPDIQKKGQDEIDKVIGSGRLPDFNDRVSLPYIDALYRELLRYYPPTPSAVPHCTEEDDSYKGYFIPKGAVIFPNVWAMTRDEKSYPDPNEFKPERFIDEMGQVMSDSRVLTYGFGRRICVGKYSASSTLWITIASLLACFNIFRARDKKGNFIEISDEFVYHAATSHKTPFKCSITPRSEAVRDLVANL